MPRNPVPVVSDSDRAVMESWLRAPTAPAGLVKRARIVLLAADGLGTSEIVERVGATKPTVITWRNRYIAEGVAGLDDRAKPGRPAQIDELDIVNATLLPPPAELGITHWSSRILGRQLGISNVTVAKIWKRWGLKPWKLETFKFSTDPELEAKVRDVIGLYLDPPEKAVVLSIDEKSQIRALDRTAPMLPMRPDLAARWTHDYKRNGTITLFAALEIATGKVTQACYPRHRSDEFLLFLRKVAKAYPRVDLHIVVDNYATHKHPTVKTWLAENPRVTLHFTPTSGSWMNMVEIFFGIITRQAIRRGVFHPITELQAPITRFIDAWNERCQPFTWTKQQTKSCPTPPEVKEHHSRDTRY